MIDPNFLESDEFLVECEVRNIGGSLIYQLTELKEALSKESTESTVIQHEAHSKACRNPRSEIMICSKKLTQIRESLEDISALECNIRLQPLNILQSRLLHINDRLKRISSSKTAAVQAIKLQEVAEKIMKLVTELKIPDVDLEKSRKSIKEICLETNVNDSMEESYVHPSEYTPKRNQPTTSKNVHPASSPAHQSQVWPDLENELSMVLDDLAKRVKQVTQIPALSREVQQKLQEASKIVDELNITKNKERFNIPQPETSRILYPSNYPLTPEKVVPIAVHKWNIQFDGSQSGVNIERFIFRVEHLAQSHNIFVGRLVHDLGFLLHGVAQEFYWHFLERTRDATWPQLREALIDRFKDRRTDTDIRRELDARKQKAPRETFVEFYNAMMALTMALQTPIPDLELINILMQNMRPGLQLILAGKSFSTIPKLVSRCIATEDSWRRLNYIPEQNIQPRRSITELSLDNEYALSGEIYPKVSSIQFPQKTVPTNNCSQAQSVLPNELRRNRVTIDVSCWNCNIKGHSFMDCPLPLQRMFCFGCGYPNVLRPHCFKCNPGNSNTEMRSGGPHFRKILNRVSEAHTAEAASNTDPELRDHLQFK